MPADTSPAESESPHSCLTSREPTPFDDEAGATGADKGSATEMPLHLCLQAYMTNPGTLMLEVCDSVPFAINPWPMFMQMGDVKTILKGKARAHFEIHPLLPDDEESDQYPEEVLTMSARFFDLLSMLITDVEDTCNAGVPNSTRGIVSLFMCGYTHTEEDFYVLLVQSKLMFRNLPTEQQASSIVPRVKQGDIGNEESSVLISPSQAKSLANKQGRATANNSNGGPSTGNAAAPDVLRICNLHNPLAWYTGLGPLLETKVEVPDVYDEHGTFIHPQDYAEKLAGARFVKLEAYIKLCIATGPDSCIMT
ncbi:hypothetical protein BDR07DRAFT_1478893 [Suillus spraguei]|nr:hypothetical protein BDR07DRAFT_1478893 [Suillus spraguei]